MRAVLYKSNFTHVEHSPKSRVLESLRKTPGYGHETDFVSMPEVFTGELTLTNQRTVRPTC